MEDAGGSNRRLLPRHIPALDGLRGCAILLVLFLHFTLREPAVSTAGVRAIRNTFALGWTGVDLFFILSGFLITGLLFDAKGQPGYFKGFYARRALRILPLYYGALLLIFLVPCLLGSLIDHADFVSLRDQLWYWTYLQNYHEAKAVPGEFLGAFWTLAIEEQFYLVWPLLIFLTSRKQALWVCLACVIGAIGYRSYMVFLGHSPDSISHLTPARVDALAIGSGIALLVRGSGGLELVRKLSQYAIASGIIILAVAFLRSGPAYHHDILMLTLGSTAIPLAYGGALVQAVGSAGIFARALQSRLLAFFGRYSYGLYVIHFPVTVLLAKAQVVPYEFAGIGSPAIALIIYTAFVMAVCVGCAWAIWHLYEKRFLLLKRHFQYGARIPATATSPLAV